jgi:hypothetical protein
MSVRIPIGPLTRALKFVLCAASKDDVTPVLTGVKWTVEGGVLTLTATDRYRVCTATVGVDSAAELDVLMQRSQAAWILAQVHKPVRLYPDQFVEVSAVDREPLAKKPRWSITARVVAGDHEDADEFSMTAEGIVGNFPPVDRLFVEPGKAEPAASVGLSPGLMDFLKLMPGYRGEPIRMYAPEGGETKNAPVRFESLDKSLRALLQPNILVKP